VKKSKKAKFKIGDKLAFVIPQRFVKKPLTEAQRVALCEVVGFDRFTRARVLGYSYDLCDYLINNDLPIRDFLHNGFLVGGVVAFGHVSWKWWRVGGIE
jgi:hypothetical protein